MIVFYTEEVTDDSLYLEGDEMRHCLKANRKKIGDEITVFDEKGIVYTAEISNIDRHKLGATIRAKRPTEKTAYQLCIAIVPTKNADRIEWFVSKAVEIGIQKIILMKTANAEHSKYKYNRLKRIAFSAAKQSLNFTLPDIVEAKSMEEAMALTSEFNKKYIAHCLDPKTHILTKSMSLDDRVVLMIGPEGDFTKEEISLASHNGYEEVNLGPSRLRTETAGVVAITLLNGLLQAHN